MPVSKWLKTNIKFLPKFTQSFTKVLPYFTSIKFDKALVGF